MKSINPRKNKWFSLLVIFPLSSNIKTKKQKSSFTSIFLFLLMSTWIVDRLLFGPGTTRSLGYCSVKASKSLLCQNWHWSVHLNHSSQCQDLWGVGSFSEYLILTWLFSRDTFMILWLIAHPNWFTENHNLAIGKNEQHW